MITYPFTGETPAEKPIDAGVTRARSFFRSLSTEALNGFGRHASYMSYETGSRLYSEEDIPAKIFILLQGQVKVSMSASNRRHLILRIAMPGEMVGLSAALSGGLYEETAQAIAPCRAIVLHCEEFGRLLKEHPSACSAVIREMGVQYEQACARLRLTAISTAQARLAQLVLDWAETAQQTEYGIRIQVGLTHGEIGECIGVGRASVTRILSDLQRRRIVELRGSILTISNRAALESHAGPAWRTARLPANPSNLVMMSRAKMRWSENHRPATSPA